MVTTLRNQKAWLFRRYFAQGISLFGIIYCAHIFPINSREELVDKLITCIIIIAFAALGVLILGKMMNKTYVIEEDCLKVKKMFKTRKYTWDEISDVELEKGKRTRSGHWGTQLRFTGKKKHYVINSTEYEKMDPFICALKKHVEVKKY